MTTISQQQGGPQSIAMLKAYFDANPTAAADLQRLQQPLASLSGRCKLPVTVGTEILNSSSVPAQRPVTGQLPGPGSTPPR